MLILHPQQWDSFLTRLTVLTIKSLVVWDQIGVCYYSDYHTRFPIPGSLYYVTRCVDLRCQWSKSSVTNSFAVLLLLWYRGTRVYLHGSWSPTWLAVSPSICLCVAHWFYLACMCMSSDPFAADHRPCVHNVSLLLFLVTKTIILEWPIISDCQ